MGWGRLLESLWFSVRSAMFSFKFTSGYWYFLQKPREVLTCNINGDRSQSVNSLYCKHIERRICIQTQSVTGTIIFCVLCTLCVDPAFQHIGDLLNSCALFGQRDPQAKMCWGGH